MEADDYNTYNLTFLAELTGVVFFFGHLFFFNVTDETRAGERGVNPFELLQMLSGEGTYDLSQIPRVVLWRSGSAFF